jgi:hypothetical protein
VAGDGARCGSRRGTTQRGDGAAVARWLGAGGRRGEPRERSEELGISISCCSVDGVDRGESLNGPVGPVAVLSESGAERPICLRFQRYVL